MYEQPFNPYAGNVAVVKDYFKNGKVLAMGILYIVSLVLSIASSIFTMTNQNALTENMMQLIGQVSPELYENIEQTMPQIQNSVASGSNVGSIVTLVISSIVTVLFIAAYIIIYTKSRNNAPDSTPQAGVSILRVFAILTMILTILGVIIAVAAVVILYGLMGAAFRDGQLPEVAPLPDGTYINVRDAATIVIVVLGVVVVLATIYALIFVINRVRYYGAVKNSLTTVELDERGAKGYGVMCIIGGVFMALSVLGSLTNVFTGLGGYKIFAIISLLANVVSTVMMFIEGSLALGYRKHIENYKYGYNNGGYNDYNNSSYGNPDPSYVMPPVNNDPYGSDGQGGYMGYSPEQQPTPNYANEPAPQNSFEDIANDSPVDEKPAVCPNCGAPTGNYPFCSKCGTKL